MARIEDYLNRKFEKTPTKRIGIGGFSALVRIEERTSKTSDSPMTPVEDGSFVNDHIILNPVRLSIQGDVSDIFVEPSPILAELKRTQSTVGKITQYAPPKTQSQVQQANALANDIADVVRAADALIGAGESVVNFFGNKDNSSKGNRELFIDAMDSLFYGKQLFPIETEYRLYENMVMTSFEVRHNNSTESTQFSIEAIEFRFATTVFTELASAPNPADGTNGQLQVETSKGAQTGEKVDESLATTIKRAIGL